MNTIFRTTLFAAMVVLPTAAFAQPVAQVDEVQVVTMAYEVVGIDSPPVTAHTAPGIANSGAHAGALPGGSLRPGSDVGLNSIYVPH